VIKLLISLVSKGGLMTLRRKLKPSKSLGPLLEQISKREAHFVLIREAMRKLGCKMSYLFFLALCKEEKQDPKSLKSSEKEMLRNLLDVSVRMCHLFSGRGKEVLPEFVVDTCLDEIIKPPIKNTKVVSIDRIEGQPFIRESITRVGKGAIRRTEGLRPDNT